MRTDLCWDAAAVLALARGVRTLRRARTVAPLQPAADEAYPPGVTIVVPARNEAAVLDDCLRGLRAQNYPGVLRIVVVDDASTDDTGAIARAHAARDPLLSVVRSAGPPPGWSGKVHAMHAGVCAAPDDGEWLWFTDADTIAAPDLLARLVATAEALDADLVSTPAGPPAHGGSATWPLLMPPGLQLIAENAAPDGRGRKAFAIGHCILVRRSYLDKIGGWAALRDRRNEDIVLATAVREHGGSTRIVDAVGHLSTTGMDPLSRGWASYRKSFAAALHGRSALIAALGVTQALVSLAPVRSTVAGLRGGRPVRASIGALCWAVQGVAHARTARLMRTDPRLAPAAPATGALFGVLLLDAAARSLRGHGTWKDRHTPS